PGTRTRRGGSASWPACPKAPRSWRTATRARARLWPRWRSGPRATRPATTPARGTSGRATTTCRQNAEGRRSAPQSRALLLVLLLDRLRLEHLDLVARDRGDALLAARDRQAARRRAGAVGRVVLEARLEERRELDVLARDRVL